MSVRKDRQSMILQLISDEPISTQDELIQKLREHGYDVTQATISRDIKELQLVKRIGDGGKSVYSVSTMLPESGIAQYSSIIEGAIVSTDYAQNICVIKTHSGMANAACASIDSMNWNGVVGTLAGDDTFFVVCRDEDSARRFCDSLNQMIHFS